MRSMLRSPLVMLALVAASACSMDSGPGTPPALESSAHAAAAFDQLADSVAKATSADAAAPYRNLAGVIRQAGQLSSIVVHIDNEDVTFSALGQETVLSGSAPCPVAPTVIGVGESNTSVFCPIALPLKTRMLVAWQPDQPARMLQLLATAEQSAVGYDPSNAASIAQVFSPSTLQYADGKGGTWWATAGTQSNGMTLGSVCPAPATADGKAPSVPTACNLATFTWSFSATVAPFPFALKNNTATAGAHTLSLAKSTVLGAQLKFALPAPAPSGPKPDTTGKPPTVATNSALVASLAGTVAEGVVSLTLTVRNPTASAVTASFPSTEEYDFYIKDVTTGKLAWSWSANRSFAQVLTSRTVPAGGSLTYTEKWTATVHGPVVAVGVFTSSTHKLVADASLTIP